MNQRGHAITFHVSGNPIPKARARVMIRPGGTHAYTPKRTRAWEHQVAWAGRQAMNGRQPLDGPLALSLHFTRKDRRRCDGDNLEKSVVDALNGVCWLDDEQIVECHRYKHVDPRRAGVIISVWQVEVSNDGCS